MRYLPGRIIARKHRGGACFYDGPEPMPYYRRSHPGYQYPCNKDHNGFISGAGSNAVPDKGLKGVSLLLGKEARE